MCPLARPGLFRKTLMQTQIVAHTQPLASLPAARLGSLAGLEQLEPGRDDPGSRALECQGM